MAKTVKALPWDKLLDKSSLPKLIKDWTSGRLGGRPTAESKLGQYYVFDIKVLKKVFNGMTHVKINKDQEYFKRGSQQVELPASIRGKKLLKTNVTKSMLKDMHTFIKAHFNNRQKQFKDNHSEKYKSMYGRGGKNLKQNLKGIPSHADRWIVKDYNEISRDWKNIIAPEITDILINKMLKEGSINPSIAKGLRDSDLISSAIRGDENTQASSLNIRGKAVTQENALGMQLGHGEYGKPVSGLQAEAIANTIERDFKAGKIDEKTYLHMKSLLLEFEDEVGYTLNTEAVEYDPKKGKFEIRSTLIVSSQLASANKLDASDVEQRLIEELLFMMTAQERPGGGLGFFLGIDVADKLVERTAKTFRGMGIEVKTALQKRKQAKLDEKAGRVKRSTAKTKIRQQATIITGLGTIGLKDFIAKTEQKQRAAKGRLKTGSKSQLNYEIVKNRVRSKLYEEIRDRMEYPRLQFDSGTFAESVNLKSLIQTGDKLRAEYTYNLDRYGTFEAGGRLHTSGRDPKRLIEEVLIRLIYSEGQVIPNIFKRA